MAPPQKRSVAQSEASEWGLSPPDEDWESLGPSPQEDITLSQTDNVTPTRERAKRRRSSVSNQVSYSVLKKEKTIHDKVYGAVTLPPLLVAVMDTEEFQRLDHICQLGGSHHVFPGARHSRKEHSIGTSHMAGAMVKHLQRLQPELGIDENDVACVQLAALCHDIGHGPYSHMWETFVHSATGNKDWTHEAMSARLIRRALAKNGIDVARYLNCDEADARRHVNFRAGKG